MKNVVFCLYLSICLTLLHQIAVAQAQLVVFSEGGERFWLIINGIRQNNLAQTNVTATNLQGQFFKIKVVFENEQLGSVDKNVGIEQGYELKCVVKRNRKNLYTIQNFDYNLLQTNDKPNTTFTPNTDSDFNTELQTDNPDYTQGIAPHVCLSAMTEMEYQSLRMSAQATLLDQIRLGMIDEVLRTTCPTTAQVRGLALIFTNEENRLRMIQNSYPYVLDKQNFVNLVDILTQLQNKNAFNSFMMQQRRNPATPTPTTTTNPPSKNNPNQTSPLTCKQSMSANTFTQAQNSLQNEAFDETKLLMAKQIVSNHCPTTAQVRTLALLFSFEQSKLDFTKYAYDFTLDKGSYFQLYDIFSFSSSKQELIQHTKGR